MTEPRVLDWRPAEKQDRQALAHFVCTEPEKEPYSPALRRRLPHPRRPEFEAQQIIRRDCHVPPTHGYHLWVGYDVAGLAAVVQWREMDGPGVIHLEVVGVALRHRQRGSATAGKVAREAFTVALVEAEARAIGACCAELYVEGEIHRTNSGSLRLVHEFGFVFVDEYPSGAQTWARRIPLI